MEKSFDLKSAETVQSLVKIINESGLPLTSIQYILTDLLIETKTQLSNKLNAEKAELAKEEETKGISKHDTVV